MVSAPSQFHTGLARALSKLGCCSRSQAAELIRAGRVRLNGVVRRNPQTLVVLSRDRIELNEHEVHATAKAYWMLNKPRGAVTSASDEQGRETVYKYLPRDSSWLAPVGRLDKASEGLLLFTNDSEWAARVTSPESHVDKAYHVQIAGTAGADLLERLRGGVRSAGGEVLRLKKVEILRQGAKTSWLIIVLDEGRNRHIRRLFEALAVEVLRLVRVAIGNLHLGELSKGECRQLTNAEVSAAVLRHHR